jgi:hypothetical protein
VHQVHAQWTGAGQAVHRGPTVARTEGTATRSPELGQRDLKASVLDAYCTYFSYLSIGLLAGSCLFGGNIDVLYPSAYYPCYPGFGVEY